MSMASGELRLLPNPLLVRTQKVPSLAVLMPENPCTGWPAAKGTLRPVGRGAARSERNDVPGTLPGVSWRRPSGVVYFPDSLRLSGASLGAATKLAAGRRA